MRFSQFFISRPIFAIVLSLFITVVVAICYLGLGATALPDALAPAALTAALSAWGW